MSFPLHVSPFTRTQLYRRLQQAYGQGDLRVARRIQALLALADGLSVHEIALRLGLGDQTVRDYRHAFLWKGLSSLRYKRSPGRPST
jgi:transposase